MKRLRFYSFITIALISVFQISCTSSGRSVDKTVAAKPTADVSALVKKADDLFDKRDDGIANLREVVRILKEARDPVSRNFEVEWKFARANYFLSKRADNEAERKAAFTDGIEAGLIALRIEPDKPDGHFWYGANLGQQAKESPLTAGLTKVDDIRKEMMKVIEVQPDYQGASAYSALAEIELSTGLIGGKPEKAIEYLEKAIQLEDKNTYLHLHLGKAYLAVGRKDDARKQFDYLLKMKPTPGYQFEYDESTAEAKKLLRERF